MIGSRAVASGVLAVALLGIVLATTPLLAADLAAARALYASASYEEALTVLASLDQSENVEQLHQLRALCLLALGRTPDAEQAIVSLVMHNPTYRIEQSDVSPKLVSLFRDVRRRQLPEAARSVYAKGKSHYDAKRWPDAKSVFTTLLALLNDPDAAAEKAALADLKQLGEGFLKLTEAEIAAEERRVADAAAAKAKADEAARMAAAAAEAAQQAAIAAAAPAVYSVDNPDVVPPVELRRAMPRWVPPTRAMAAAAHTGLLVLIIDESGVVTDASIAKTIAPAYDQALRDAARTWRYKPATKGGQPVRYRQVLEIVLRPSAP